MHFAQLQLPSFSKPLPVPALVEIIEHYPEGEQPPVALVPTEVLINGCSVLMTDEPIITKTDPRGLTTVTIELVVDRVIVEHREAS